MKRNLIAGCAVLAASAGVLALVGAETVPDRFEVTLLASGLNSPKGIDSVRHQAGGGVMGDYLFVVESGSDQLVEVDRYTGEVEYVADTLGEFPVGVACFAGSAGPYMYVGNAMGGGLVRIDVDGFAEPFALLDKNVAGMDFGKGQFGQDLYVGEWALGNIYRVDQDGNDELFASIPNCETRYVKFSEGGQFGHFLYFTDYVNGDIYRLTPEGEYTLFASTESPCLEGFAFSSGGAFGKFLYVGDICTGDIFRVAPDGTVELWASGFEGVADIIFKPGTWGGFTMYIVDGHDKVYAISKV